jgi:hypothetical protein
VFYEIISLKHIKVVSCWTQMNVCIESL